MNQLLKSYSPVLILRSIICCTLFFIAATGYAMPDGDDEATTKLPGDSVAESRNIFVRLYDFVMSPDTTKITGKPKYNFFAGPSYSVDTKFNLGLLLTGAYTTDPSDTTLMNSFISFPGQVSTGGYYMIGIEGTHVSPHDTRRLNYASRISFFSPSFWGLGFQEERNDDIRTKYQRITYSLNSDYQFHTVHSIYVGPSLHFNYTHAMRIRDISLWHGQPMTTMSLGAGFVISYDTRDNLNSPYKGIFVEVVNRFYPDIFGHRSANFNITEVETNYYHALWRGGVIATHFHGAFTLGTALWTMMPQLGGHMGFRGYYEGRYRDRNEMNVMAELRQHVWRRFGFVTWVGAGTVFHDFSQVQYKNLLPTLGLGLRFELRQRTNICLDLGFGRGEMGVAFQLNEVF